MTEQPVETEQQFLGNADHVHPMWPRVAQAATASIGVEESTVFEFGALPEAPRQSYAPGAHRLAVEYKPRAIDVPAAEATFITQAKQTDLWLDAEEQATRALAEIQDGNINAGIACLQAALAFAQNYRHSLTEETTR